MINTASRIHPAITMTNIAVAPGLMTDPGGVIILGMPRIGNAAMTKTKERKRN
jgi:hypothetical protein